MPTKDNNTLKYNHGKKSIIAPWAVYGDFECLPMKQQSCQNNPNDSYTERKAIHEACGYSLDLVSSLDSERNKHSLYRRRDCTKKFSKELKSHTTKIINFKEKDMIPLTDQEIMSYEKQKVCHVGKKNFDKNEQNKFELYQKVRDHCIIQENLEELLIAFVI